MEIWNNSNVSSEPFCLRNLRQHFEAQASQCKWQPDSDGYKRDESFGFPREIHYRTVLISVYNLAILSAES